MKVFFYQLRRELKVGLPRCISVLGKGQEGLCGFTRRHPDWPFTALSCLLFPPLLAIGAGPAVMGLMRVSAHET